MSSQQPEAKDRLGQNIKNSISDDLSINRPLAGTVTNTPDNWVKSPEDESETSKGCEELSCSIVLGGHRLTARHNQLVDDDEVSCTSHSIVSPFLATSGTKSSEEAKEHHDEVSYNSNEDGRSIETSKESQIEEQERGGERPVDVTGPEDLTVDVLNGVGDVLVGFLDDDVGEGVSVTRGHSEVGNGGKDGDEGCDNVEESLLDWDPVSHANESKGREEHEYEDDPEGLRTSRSHLLIVCRSWDDGWDWGD